MISNRTGKRLATTVLVMVVSVAMLTLTMGATASASARGTIALAVSTASHHTIVVYPNGHDDTADIQAAFNACVSYGPGCTVQLVKGTYYTAQIAVYGFQGSFVGAGQGGTVIQGLPDLPSPNPAYNTATNPFWTGLPGPSNPWPILFTFVNGTFKISGMTITDPYSVAVSPGWDSSSIGGIATDTALYAAIEITGFLAYATIDHVTVLGTSGDATGTNMWDAIAYEGLFLPAGWTYAVAQRLSVSGAFTVTNSVFNSVESGPWTDTLANAVVTVCYNTLTNSPVPLGFFDASNSQLTFCGNWVPSVPYYTAFEAIQSLDRPDTPSTVYITGNDFQVNDGANAVWLEDDGPVNFGTAPTLSAVVSGNVFQTDTSCGCYVGSDPSDYSVLLGISLASLSVSDNTILGGGSAGVYVVGGPAVVSGNTILGSYAGVWVDYADHVQVIGNVVKNSGEYGIAVTDGSSYNLVAWNVVKHSGVDDLYWDGTGTGNVWFGNVCQTSSPPGLC